MTIRMHIIGVWNCQRTNSTKVKNNNNNNKAMKTIPQPEPCLPSLPEGQELKYTLPTSPAVDPARAHTCPGLYKRQTRKKKLGRERKCRHLNRASALFSLVKYQLKGKGCRIHLTTDAQDVPCALRVLAGTPVAAARVMFSGFPSSCPFYTGSQEAVHAAFCS